MEPTKIKIKGEVIRLGQFLKLANLASTGGEAKVRIQTGEIRVNGRIELRRGLQLKDGDEIIGDSRIYVVEYFD